MKVHLLERNAMHPTLRLGQTAQDGNGLIRRPGVQPGSHYEAHDVGKMHRMLVMMVGVVVAVIMMMAVCLSLVLVLDEGKAAHGNPAAYTLTQGRLPAVGRHHRRQIGKYALAQGGQGVEQRCDEHVAGQPANRIQMKMTGLRVQLRHDLQIPESRRALRG